MVGMTLSSRTFMVIGALSGLLSVAAGAFGAHALESRLDSKSIATFQTAARYQIIHALALLIVAWFCMQGASARLRVAGWSFIVGTILFCVRLYALSLGGPRILGAITPFGGLAFMVGWGSLALHGWAQGK